MSATIIDGRKLAADTRAEIAAGTQVTVVCGGRTFKADCDVSDRQRGALLAAARRMQPADMPEGGAARS